MVAIRLCLLLVWSWLLITSAQAVQWITIPQGNDQRNIEIGRCFDNTSVARHADSWWGGFQFTDRREGDFGCYVVALRAGDIGTLNLKTGPDNKKYRLVVVELENKKGKVFTTWRSTEDHAVSIGKRHGRAIILTPENRNRRFIVGVIHEGGKSGHVLLAFNAITPELVFLYTAGKIVAMQALVGAAVESLGLSGTEAEVAETIGQLAIGAALSGDEEETFDQVLQGAGTVAPHLMPEILAQGAGFVLNLYKTFKSEFYRGFDHDPPWKIY